MSAVRQAGPALRRRVLHDAFRRAAGGGRGLTRRHLQALDALLSGEGSVPLPGGFAARRAGGELRLEPAARLPADRNRPRVEPGEVRVRPGAWTAWRPGRCRVRVRRIAEPERIPRRGRTVEIVSERLLAEPLRLRGWRAGDRFRPLGLRGQKKLQDFFVDAKVPRAERQQVALLLAGERIAWVVGHRVAEDFRWEGSGPGCLVEVRFDGRRAPLSARPHAD